MGGMVDDPHVVAVDLYFMGRGRKQACNSEYVTSDQSSYKFASIIGCCERACLFTEFDGPQVPCLCTEENYTCGAEGFVFVRHK